MINKLLIYLIALTVSGIVGFTQQAKALPAVSKARVISSGGDTIRAGDNSYTLKFTIGQPTPVSDPLVPSSPDGHKLKPGFWYTREGFCVNEFDIDMDGDVDGKDIVAFAAAFAGDPSLAGRLSVLARSFSGNDCDLEIK